MESWDGWPFARLYMLLVALAFAVIGLQVLLFHWRAGFRRWTMYGPVLFAPVLVVAAVLGAVQRDGFLGWFVLGVFVLGMVDGLVGVVEHLRGIARRVGGFSLRNLMSGPPPLLPVAFTALALTGVLALVWEAL
ncbi:MAG: hypothetical protein ICV59_03920 [Thermoleophilia bacterium]|nr:hypothetical protein [Thermoleophilia bacterium]